MLHKGNLLRWLVILNVIAIAFFGVGYLNSVIKARQLRHKKAMEAASIMVKVSQMNMADATKLMDISTDLENGSRISDADLNWCLVQLKGNQASPQLAISRRQDVDIVLSQTVGVLTPSQKENLFQALTAQMAMDNPSEEIGIDILWPARLLSSLGDKRAIPILEPHTNDPRPRVHSIVQQAIAGLEGKAVK